MSTYEAFLTDKDLEKNGVELDLGDAGRFQIARAGGGNMRYLKRLEAITKPHRLAIQRKTLPVDLSVALYAQLFAETVVLGWEGVTGPDGQPLEFSEEACKQLLIDLPDLFQTIKVTAEDASIYRQTVREEDAGN